MANAYFYSNTAVATTLAGNISGAATSLSVAATTGFPSTTPYVLAVDYGAATEELVLVTAAAGTSLTVTRGFGSTSAQSHSLGAVVRHVVNAVDLTDFRTHEAATAAVHGVAGTLVGTSDTQTLANKTLTSPTINGGALSGTFTGTPTFSGALTFSGNPTFSNGLTAGSSVLVDRATATDNAFRARVTGDAQSRFIANADGKLSWGGGSATTDTTLYREAAGILATEGILRSIRTAAGNNAFASRVAGDTNSRWFVNADGEMNWGPGDATADVNLYRSAANVLKTDDTFAAAGLTVTGTTWTTYTPAVTGGGSVTWTTRTGYYYKIGKIVYVTAYLTVNTAGTGSANVQIDMPSTVDRSTRQVLGASVENMGLNGHSHAVFFTSGTGGTVDRIRSYDGQNLIGSDLLAGGLLTIQGWYREA